MIDFKIDTEHCPFPSVEVGGEEIADAIDKLVFVMEAGCIPRLWVRYAFIDGEVKGKAELTELPTTKFDPTPMEET